MDVLPAEYALNDGEIRSLEIGVEYGSASGSPQRQASVALLVRKKAANGKLVPCLLQIHMTSVQKVVVNEEFDSCHYSDVVFKKVENNLWYLSLDPYGNSGEPHAEDNLVLIAESIEVKEGAILDRF